MPDASSRSAAWFAALLCLLLVACGGPDPKASPVEDTAGLLTPAEMSSLVEWHAALLAQYDIDYRVLTVASTDDPSRLAIKTFESAGVGEQSHTGRGLLLAIDAGGRRVRLEVARQLENGRDQRGRRRRDGRDTGWRRRAADRTRGHRYGCR